MTDWHVRATWLPEGTAPEERWLSARGWNATPSPDSVDLPGSFALAGLVDAHSHVSFGSGAHGPIPLDGAGADANRARLAHDGVAVLRDAGGDPAVVLGLKRMPGRPFVVAAGRHLAPAGMYFEAVHDPVEAASLSEIALRELALGASWAKLVADFPPAAARAVSPSAAAEPAYDVDVIGRFVTLVHQAGGRVAAHVTTPLVADLVRLGIDSVEHGTALDEAAVADMARRGTAWTPTLCAVLSVAPGAPAQRRRLVSERQERFRTLIPLAIAAGVPVLTGSDVVGSVPREVALLVECGVVPIDALRAATTTAMRFLGADVAEAPPSVVTYQADPRDDPAVLAQPSAVVIDGIRVR